MRRRRAGDDRSAARSLGRWALLLGAAEAVGMTAAAGAAKGGQALVGEPGNGRDTAVIVGLATLAGAVEGIAVALAMATALRPSVPDLPVRPWLSITTLVAAAGWAGASLPGASAGTSADSQEPPMLFVIAGAACIGLFMGAFLGAAQALILRRHHVRHPWRWTSASALAWTPAMVVIFVGAGTPDADWPVAAVVVLGALTGAVAGAVLGLVLGWSARSLDGPAMTSRALVATMSSPLHRMLPATLIGLSVQGRTSLAWHRFPVMAARGDHSVLVFPGRAEGKQWWRNVTHTPAVQICQDGRWADAHALVLHRGDQCYEQSIRAYRQSFPHTPLPDGSLIVRIVPGPAPQHPSRTRYADSRP